MLSFFLQLHQYIVVECFYLDVYKRQGLFSNILWTKLFAVLFLALSCLGTKGVKEQKITWRSCRHGFPDRSFAVISVVQFACLLFPVAVVLQFLDLSLIHISGYVL